MTAHEMKNVTSQNLLKIAFVSPGYKPVPDVAGGAVEHLMTQIIEENEKNPRFYFELYTISDKALNAYPLKYTHINQIKNFRKTFFIRAFSFILNSLFTVCRCNARFNYFGREVARRLPADIAFILIENDVNIFKQIKQKMQNTPIVFHLHNDFDTLGEMQKSAWSMKYVADNASEIWTVSAYLKKHLLSAFKNISDSKIRVLENGIDRERFSVTMNDTERSAAFRKKYEISDSQFVILYAGRILRQKGVYELLQAVSLLPEDMDCVLVIAGDIRSAPRMYRKQLKKILPKIKCRVVFTGYIPQYEIQNAYAAAGIVTIPSQCQEAFCLVALEASCHCKPCVASISGGMADVLDDSCAKMISLGDGYVENFRDAIYELYKDEGLRIKLAENAAKNSLQFPDRKHYFENFCAIAENFISSRGSSPC
ncbi:MAG: glycosyltransferase family 4 protein [Treponema sp.]|nr:glycosyltransferase family 4 protein [Treponema sp.]